MGFFDFIQHTYYVNGNQVGFVDALNFTDPNQISDLNSSGPPIF